MEDKVVTGIKGLDEMIGSGIPRGHILALLGSCGTGKTTLSLQYIWNGLAMGEKAIFISLEEDEEAIKKNAANYGWDLQPHIDGRNLLLVKLEPADAKNTIMRIKSELPRIIKEFGAKRVVLDSVSLLSMMFDEDAEKRTTLFSLCKQIKETGATAMFTAEVKEDNPSSSRDGLVEYVADGVISLRYRETEDSGDVQLSIRIIKMRRTSHARKIKPYSITQNGIEVHAQAEMF